MPGRLIVATCQYPVDRDIGKNLSNTLMQIETARSRGADIAHFSECSLSGYAGIDFGNIWDQDEQLLDDAFAEVKEKARKLGLWVILGSHYFAQGHDKPYNSLFLIDDQGQVRGRYDKRLLTHGAGGSDMKHYSPGEGPFTFQLKGVTCGLMICHEWRYPELYREYMRMNTELLFQSWYDGNLSPRRYREAGKELGALIVGTVKGHAASNYLWISASNTSRKESCFPGFVVRPDGMILNKMKRNRQEVLISDIDTNKDFPDPTGHLRNQLNRFIKY